MILENLISELESIISQSLKRTYAALNGHLLENRWPPVLTQVRAPTSRLIGHDVLFNINTRNYHPESVVDIGGTLDIMLPNVGLELTVNIAGTNVNIYAHPPRKPDIFIGKLTKYDRGVNHGLQS